MNRPIKFRAWDKQIGLMEYILKSGKVHTELNELIQELEKRYELMQFTGLLDKNGSEIFEGDILKTRSNGVVEVIFENGAVRYKHKDLPTPKIWPHLFSIRSEVIGNIYQNLKLIK